MPRTFRAVLLIGLFLSGCCAAEERDLTILHFNDLHAATTPDPGGHGGLAYLSAVIRREEMGCHACLLLSAGDLVQGTPVSTLFRGMPLYEIANLLRIDAATLGNHEFDYGWRQVEAFMHKARYPVVDADVVDGQGKLMARKPYVILKRNGLRVGVIGIMTEALSELTTPDTRGPWRVAPLMETVHKYASELRPKTDVLILLAHIGPAEEDRVLRDVPEIPVTVAGHIHTGLDKPKTYDGRVLVRVAASGRELGRLDLKVNLDHKQVTSAQWKRIPVDTNSVAPAPDVARQVERWEKQVAKIVDEPIGEAKRTIAGADLKALIERATAEEMGTDFAFMNRGGIRAALPAGRLLARHVWNVYPFDNRVVVGKFKGRELPAVVTAGKKIDPEREYTLATNDFTAANQESPTQLGTKGLKFPQVGPLQRDMLIGWIKKKKVLE